MLLLFHFDFGGIRLAMRTDTAAFFLFLRTISFSFKYPCSHLTHLCSFLLQKKAIVLPDPESKVGGFVL